MAGEEFILKTVLALEAHDFIHGAKASSEAFAQMVKDVKAGSAGLSEVGQMVGSLGSTLSRTVSPVSLKFISDASSAYIDFESVMTDVKKTTGMTGAELDQMGNAIRSMSKEIPSTTQEIAGLAATGAQVGIAKGKLLGFARTMTDLSNATNIAGEEGAASLARFANITKMSQDDFDRFGSTIVALGNNFATTEKEILDMSMRLAGAGSQVGMTESDILGLATALSSVGVEAEAGGSAFSKVISQMQLAVETQSDSLGKFAKVANLSAVDFSKLFKSNSAEALNRFVAGLSDTERLGMSTTQVLKALGIEEIRLTDALKRVSGAGDLLNRSLQTGKQAWKENSALAAEASERYGTVESQLQMSKNAMKDALIGFGKEAMPLITNLVKGLTGLVEWFNKLPEPAKESAMNMAVFSASLGPVLSLTGKGLQCIDAMATSFKGIKDAVSGAGDTLGLVGKAFKGFEFSDSGLSAFASGLKTTTDAAGNSAKAIGEVASAAGSTVQAVSGIASAAATSSTALAGVGTAATATATAATGATSAIGAGAAGLSGALVLLGAVAVGVTLKKMYACTQGMKDLKAEAKSASKAFSSTTTTAEAQARQAENLAKTIDKLAAVEHKSAKEKGLLKAAVESLNTLMPSLNLAYDEQSDKLNKSTADIMGNIKAMEQQAKAQAAMELQTKAYATQIEAEQLKKKAVDVGSNWDTKKAFTNDEGNLDILKGVKEFGGAFAYKNDFKEADKLMAESEEQVKAAKEALESLGLAGSESLDTLSESYQALGETATNANEEIVSSTTEATDAQTTFADAGNELLDAAAKQYSKTGDEIGQILEGIGMQVEDLAKDLEERTTKIFSSLTNAPIKGDSTVDSLREQWAASIDAYESYMADCQAVQDKWKGVISDSFMSWVRGLGADNADLVKEISNLSEDDIKKLNQEWNKNKSIAGMAAEQEQGDQLGLGSGYFEQMSDALLKEFTEKNNYLKGQQEDLRKAFIDAMATTQGQTFETAEDFANSLAENVLNTTETISGSFEDMQAKLSAAILDIPNLSDMLQGIGATEEEKSPDQVIEETMNKTIQIVIDSEGGLREAGGLAGKALSDGFGVAQAGLVMTIEDAPLSEAMEDQMNATVAVVHDSVGAYRSAGYEAGMALVEGMQAAYDESSGGIDSILNRAHSTSKTQPRRQPAPPDLSILKDILPHGLKDAATSAAGPQPAARGNAGGGGGEREKQPANINLHFGSSTFAGFVDDISKEQRDARMRLLRG